MMPQDKDKQDTLLIVDDIPENLEVLFDALIANNFKVLIAESGESALENVQQELPDLILLDIMMPKGMDGFETCRQLKNNPKTQNIPVIFIIALSDTAEKIKGFELGAVDYVTKPFQQQEVLARINTHLTIRKLQQKLQIQNDQLIKLNKENNEFLSIAAHDLKNPLSGIQGSADFIINSYDKMSKEDVIEFATMISVTSGQAFELIKNLLEVNAIESGKKNILLSTLDILPILQWLVSSYTELANKKNISLQFQHLDKQYPAFVDNKIVLQVLENIISNAIKYSPPNRNITIRLSQDQQQLRCEVQDEGPGLSDSDKQKLFGKFSCLSAIPTCGEHSTGLGLFIVKKLVGMMNGTVWCESELGQGATFIVEFPKTSA